MLQKKLNLACSLKPLLSNAELQANATSVCLASSTLAGKSLCGKMGAVKPQLLHLIVLLLKYDSEEAKLLE